MAGFTLIELIVVVALIALMLFFSFPRFSGFLATDSRDEASRWIIAQGLSLRTRAVKTQQPHMLQVDITGNRLVAMPAPTGDATEMTGTGEFASSGAENPGVSQTADTSTQSYDLSGDMQIMDVTFAGGRTIRTGSHTIRFYEKGYSDRAVIHIQDGDERISYYFAPFLPEVKIFYDYWMFE